MTNDMPVAQSRLDVLDGLRGIAILVVVWYHAWLVSGQSLPFVNFVGEAGFLGVELFFFLSGFCLFYPYARAVVEGRPIPAVRRFLARRAAKIVPSYVLALIVFSTVYHQRFGSPYDAFVQVTSHLAFAHTFSNATYGGISGPLWTIAIEVQFYLLFPFIARWFMRAPIAGYVLLVIAAEIYRIAIAAWGLDTQFGWINQLPAFFDVFGAGMVAAYALVVLRRRFGGDVGVLATTASVVTFAVLLGALAIVSSIDRTIGVDAAHAWLNAHRILIGPLCFVLALPAFFAAERWRAIVASPLLAFLSLISYNLYLWNLEIAVWFRAAGLAPAWTFVLSIAASIGVAAAITYVLERPILNASAAGSLDVASLRARATAALRSLGRHEAWRFRRSPNANASSVQ